MAAAKVTSVKLAINDWSDAITAVAATTAADGVLIDMTNEDNKLVILATNTAEAAKTVTVKKGDGIGGVKDIAAESIAAGATKAIRLDSSEFKNVSGTNKGMCLIVPESTDVTFMAIQLP